MLEFYKTFEDGITKKIDAPQHGCWISAIAPTQQEIDYLINEIGVLPEFVKASLDEEESSHIDYDDDEAQTLVIVDYLNADEDDAADENTLLYTTLPLGVVIMKGYIVTICLYDNLNIEDMAKGRIRGMNTDMKTRFLLLLLLKIAQRFLIYLRQIDRVSSRTEKRLHQSMRNQELIQMLGLEKSLVYFSTSLKANEVTLEKMLKMDIMQKYKDDQDVLEDVIIENKQAIEMTDIYSNILSSTMDFFASVISNNLNIVMKVLASVTILMAIPTIIGGIFGMNVALPLQDNPQGFIIIIFLTIILTLITAFILYKKDMFS